MNPRINNLLQILALTRHLRSYRGIILYPNENAGILACASHTFLFPTFVLIQK